MARTEKSRSPASKQPGLIPGVEWAACAKPTFALGASSGEDRVMLQCRWYDHPGATYIFTVTLAGRRNA
jgi:hypothetical protein